MASRIDLQGLQKELDGFRNKVERWSQGMCSSAESARDTHFQLIREFQGARPLVLHGLVTCVPKLKSRSMCNGLLSAS